MEKTEMELNIFALATPTLTSWQVQRAQPPIFLSDKLRRQSALMIFARDRDTTAGDSILLPQKEKAEQAESGRILAASLKNDSLTIKWQNGEKCDFKSTILIEVTNSGPIHTSCNQNSYVLELKKDDLKSKNGIVKMKTTSSEKSVDFSNEVIFSRRLNENEQTAIVPVVEDLFYDAEMNLLKWELSDDVSVSSGLVGFRIELRLGKTIYSADLSRDLRQISPDRVLKGNLAEVRHRESIEATLKTLSHFGSGSATRIQFSSSSGAARGFFGSFFGSNSKQVVVVAVLVGVLAIGAICLAAFKGRQICRKFCKKEDAAQVRKIWPITEEIFSKVERIVHHQTPSEPSNTSQPSLPPYASIECVARNEQLTEPFLLPPRYSVMNNAMHQHQYSTFQHHQLHQRQQEQQRQRQRQEFQAKEEINTFLRTNEPLSPLESSHAKFKSCPMIIDAQTGYCTLPPPPPTPPISQESLNLTPESSELREAPETDSFLNSTAETTLTPSQKMTLPRPTMGVAATCLRRLPLED